VTFDKDKTDVTDIKNPRLIYLKGSLFLLTGIASAALLFAVCTVVPGCCADGAVCVWSFCRFTTFAFYRHPSTTLMTGFVFPEAA